MKTFIIVTLLYVISYFAKSCLESFLFHFRAKDDPNKWSEAEKTELHPIIAFDRLILIIICCIAVFKPNTEMLINFFAKAYLLKWTKVFIYICGLSAITPFIHDGLFYVHRHTLNPRIYIRGFKSSESGTSTAFTDKKNMFDTYKQRTIWLFVGIALLIISQTI